MTRRNLIAALVVAAGAALPSNSAAQQAGEWTFTVQAGGFTYDYGNDATSPLVGVRAAWGLSRHLRLEVGGTVARAGIDVVREVIGNDGTPILLSREGTTTLGSADLALLAGLPLGRVQPYIGIASGLFVRYDEAGGDRFAQPMHAFPLGVVVDVTDRVALRGELRARFDQHQGGGNSIDSEQTIGVSIRF